MTPIRELKTAADAVHAGGLFPSFPSAEAILTAMMMAEADGQPYAKGMTRYQLVHGSLSKTPQAMLGDFIADGGRVKWTTTDDKLAEGDFLAPGHKNWQRVTFSWDQAVRAGLVNKQVWRQYPRAMLRARVISAAMRMLHPSATGGAYTPDEADSIATDNSPETPAPEPAKEVAPKTDQQNLFDTIEASGLSAEEILQFLHSKNYYHNRESFSAFTDPECRQVLKNFEVIATTIQGGK